MGLVCNLHNKDKYVIHIYGLQQALNHGLKLTKVHRVIEFKQSAFLKTFIDLNTNYRTIAKNDFFKDFFKLVTLTVALHVLRGPNTQPHTDDCCQQA